ncbi:MAG: MarR family transcriptional regulator [Rhodobacteraceae bacterium]|nr:MarR family transcriptional regulator [Paracoccaceae bacterium]
MDNGRPFERDEPEYRLDDQVGYLLRLAYQRHTLIFQDHAPNNLTPTQFSALIRLSECGPCSQNQLGRLIAVDAATIKGVVDRLYDKKLVSLEKDANDRRRILISLSPKGLDMVAGLRTMGRSVTEATLDALQARERAVFLRLLKKLV